MIGGGGFLGRHLADKLLERGYSVAVFDIRKTFSDERLKFHVGDLCNKQVSIHRMLLPCSDYPRSLHGCISSFIVSLLGY